MDKKLIGKYDPVKGIVIAGIATIIAWVVAAFAKVIPAGVVIISNGLLIVFATLVVAFNAYYIGYQKAQREKDKKKKDVLKDIYNSRSRN